MVTCHQGPNTFQHFLWGGEAVASRVPLICCVQMSETVLFFYSYRSSNKSQIKINLTHSRVEQSSSPLLILLRNLQVLEKKKKGPELIWLFCFSSRLPCSFSLLSSPILPPTILACQPQWLSFTCCLSTGRAEPSRTLCT